MKKNNSIDRTALMPNYAPAEFIPVKGKTFILNELCIFPLVSIR